ncbi:MAG: hypothetical protein ABIH23_03075, partial [bacterium]
GKRWGAHEYSDARGRAVIHLPLPNPGIMEIQVEARSPLISAPEEWIWGPETADDQEIYLQAAFVVPKAPKSAVFWVAADNRATVFLNGQRVNSFAGWTNPQPVRDAAQYLKAGENVISVQAVNTDGPAGLLVRLEMDGKSVFFSDTSWRAYQTKPPGWPNKAESEGEKAISLGGVQQGAWGGPMTGWPTAQHRGDLFAGERMRPIGAVSNSVQVQVDWRELAAMKRDPDHLVGLQWEPWFTPWACSWGTAHAVPLMGLYWSWNPDVIRQHIIWIVESGVDFLVVDWTNHLWGKEHWDERPDNTNSIIHATTIALESLAAMRDEGMPVPKMVLFLGVQNGPHTTMAAINEEIEWIYHNYIRNPRFQGLFLEYLDKPLLMIINGGGPDWLEKTKQVPVDDSHFTIRWVSSQHQGNHHNEWGYWSWMDGSLEQPVTFYEGKPECLTVSTAFFEGGGWVSEKSYGRRGGWTYVESFKGAYKYRPRFIQLHQFQEFAGQLEGQGYGPNRDIYVDSYSVEFSDDIEPVSLTAPGYRGDGGWGFFYLNLTRALVDLYRQDVPETTVVAVARPARGEIVTRDKIEVAWTSAGKPAESFTIAVNGKTAACNLKGTSAALDLSKLKDGPMRLVLTAEGTQSRYPLSYTEDSLPLEEMVPAFVEVEFFLQRNSSGDEKPSP